MATTFFISQQYLNQFLPITKNINYNDIYPHIVSAHQINIQEFLGTNFYNYLIGVYSAQTLNANEEVLVGTFIKPIAAWRTLYYLLPFISYQITNKGTLQFTSENGNPLDLDGIKYLMKQTLDRCEFYEQRLIKYLCDNSALYPQYKTNNGDDMEPFKGNTTYESDLYLGSYNSLYPRDYRLLKYLKE
jgi:hypothetical protein